MTFTRAPSRWLLAAAVVSVAILLCYLVVTLADITSPGFAFVVGELIGIPAALVCIRVVLA